MKYPEQISIELKNAIRSLFRLQLVSTGSGYPTIMLETEKKIFKDRLNVLTKDELMFLKNNWKDMIRIEKLAFEAEADSLISEIKFMSIEDLETEVEVDWD